MEKHRSNNIVGLLQNNNFNKKLKAEKQLVNYPKEL